MSRNREIIIDYIGFRGASPAIEKGIGTPFIVRPGDDESRVRRVGWPEFFESMESRGLYLVYDDNRDALDFAFLPKDEAKRALGPGRPSALAHARDIFRRIPAIDAH